jgi:putative transposase
MLKRCRVKTDEITGRFLKNGQLRKKGLNRAISDASWSELILKIEYLAAKQGKVVIKINPKHSSQECRNCGHIDKSNRDGEKFICIECGYHEHADIGAAKTIRDRGLEIVRGDSAKLAARQLNAQKVSQCGLLPKGEASAKGSPQVEQLAVSPRSMSLRGEFGNLSNQDIKVVKS